MIRFGVVAAVLALGAVGCSSEDERVLPPEELQRGVSAALNDINRKHESVSCPDGVKAQVAESATCTMTSGGARFRLTVIVKSVAGDQASYDVEVDPTPLP